MTTPQEQIKSRLSITEVVGGYVKLERAGQNLRARCPFHQEKTPSFYVSPVRGSYHCFGCGKGGDLISFVQEIEGLTFPLALATLAERAGVELRPVDPRETRERQIEQQALLFATDFFQKKLEESSVAKQYLAKRKLLPETIKYFRLGFAPAEWDSLLKDADRAGILPQALLKVGLVIPSAKTEGRYYDRFRNRIMFPILGQNGKVVGFSGRTLESDPKEAKYVNSPETALFKKGEILYGYYEAKEAIRQKNRAVVVEGQMDLLLSHQAGVKETVATSGTALSLSHIRLLARLSDHISFAFDADKAGRAALLRAISLSLSSGVEPEAILLDRGLDPADMAGNDPLLWQKRVEERKPAVTLVLEEIEKESIDLKERRNRLKNEVLPLVAHIESGMVQAHYVDEIAKVAGLSSEPVWADLLEITSAKQNPGLVQKEKVFIGNKKGLAEELEGLSLWMIEKEWAGALTEKAEAIRKRASLEPDFFTITPERKEEIAFKADFTYPDSAALEKDLERMLTRFDLENLRLALKGAQEELFLAERSGNEVLVEEKTRKCQDIASQIAQLTI
jgi:DNA primase